MISTVPRRAPFAAALLLVAGVACVSGQTAAPEPDPETRVREVLELVGTDSSLEDWDTLAEQSLSFYQMLLGEEPTEQIEEVFGRVFAKERLLESVVAHYVENYRASSLRLVERWYQSELGTRVNRLQEEAAEDDVRSDLAAYTEEITARPPASIRISLTDRLDAATRSSLNLVEMRVGMRRAVAEGLMPHLDSEEAGTPEALEQQLGEMRAQVASVTPNGVRVLLLFSLRELPIVDLVRHVEFVERPSGRWFFETQSGAFLRALEKASQDLAVELTKLLGDQPPPAE